MLQILCYFALIVCGLNAERTYYRVKSSFNGMEHYEDVTLDPEENTVSTIVGEYTPKTSHFVRTINLHDFDTGFVAFKNVDAGNCYIVKLDHGYPTEEDIRNYESGSITPTKKDNYIYGNDELDGTVLEKLSGKRIASFCRKYKSYYLVKIAAPANIKRDVAPNAPTQPLSMAMACNTHMMEVQHVDMYHAELQNTLEGHPDLGGAAWPWKPMATSSIWIDRGGAQ